MTRLQGPDTICLTVVLPTGEPAGCCGFTVTVIGGGIRVSVFVSTTGDSQTVTCLLR
jgi:hypothetical protein